MVVELKGKFLGIRRFDLRATAGKEAKQMVLGQVLQLGSNGDGCQIVEFRVKEKAPLPDVNKDCVIPVRLSVYSGSKGPAIGIDQL